MKIPQKCEDVRKVQVSQIAGKLSDWIMQSMSIDSESQLSRQSKESEDIVFRVGGIMACRFGVCHFWSGLKEGPKIDIVFHRCVSANEVDPFA